MHGWGKPNICFFVLPGRIFNLFHLSYVLMIFFFFFNIYSYCLSEGCEDVFFLGNQSWYQTKKETSLNCEALLVLGLTGALLTSSGLFLEHPASVRSLLWKEPRKNLV